MKRFKNLIVPAGLLSKDKGAIRWASKVAKMANSETVTFLHAYDLPEIPKSAVEKYP